MEMNRSFRDPQPDPEVGTDFDSGLWTSDGRGDPIERAGVSVRLSTTNT
ncbi:hypothetical protein GCM10023335_51940 [Streptomyces siamensis]|uniref:Uncharacterized protein n=1 Tax=Streptomyces siamensis TaxID=1274986 RepID=A0ABP9J5E8_9ACTN